MDAGDFALEKTFDVKFTTISSSGVPTALLGTPAIAAYPGNSTTQITAGLTLTVDFDALTGLNNVRVVATAANGYATATNYVLVLTAGTVDGTSVVGYVVGHFSIENRSALRPATADRTLDVTAANKVNGVVLVDTLTTYTGNTVQTGDSFARLGATGSGLTSLASQASVDTIDDLLDTEVAAIKSDTAAILVDTGTDGVVLKAAGLDADAANEIADALLDRTNGIETSYTLRQALRLILSSAAAKLSGAATATVAIRDVGDTKARITATVDADGNRTAVTLDAT